MDIEKIAQELSQNEKRVLLTLKKLHGKGTPPELVKTGEFSLDVEVSNAAS